MNLETLKLFCSLVEVKSLTKAGNDIGRSQSMVSTQLRKLEREVGTRLIDRTRNAFQPTPDGEICYRYCQEICRLVESLHRQMRQPTGGFIELAACYNMGVYQLPPILRQFRLDCLDVEIRVRYGPAGRVHEDVLNNAVDLGLVCYPRRRAGLAIDLFRHERLYVVCHPQHPLAERSMIEISELAGQKFVAWSPVRFSPYLKRAPDNQQHFFPPGHEFNEVEMVKRMVEMNEGIALLPGWAVESEIAGQRLVALLFENSGPTEPLAVIYRSRKKLTPAMASFINALKKPPVSIHQRAESRESRHPPTLGLRLSTGMISP